MISTTKLEKPPVRQGQTDSCIPVGYAAALGALTDRPGSEIIAEMATGLGDRSGDTASQLDLIGKRWQSPPLGVTKTGSDKFWGHHT